MDLVMIILTVFLGGIVLVLATLWARFWPRVNSIQSFRKAAPTHPLTIPRGPQRPIASYSDPSGREQVSSRSVDVHVYFRSHFDIRSSTYIRHACALAKKQITIKAVRYYNAQS